MKIKNILISALLSSVVFLAGCNAQSAELPETAADILAPYNGKGESEMFLLDKCMAGYRAAFPDNASMHVEDRWENECLEVVIRMAVSTLTDIDASPKYDITTGEQAYLDWCVADKTRKEDPKSQGIPRQVEQMIEEECIVDINNVRANGASANLSLSTEVAAQTITGPYYAPTITVQATSDLLIIENIVVNRGNCNVAKQHVGKNYGKSHFPAFVKFGKNKKVYLTEGCKVNDVIEVVVETNVGDIMFNM